MVNGNMFQNFEANSSNYTIFKNIANELNKIWNYSSIPIYLDNKTFSELCRANELALKIIAYQYKESYYENSDHPFTKLVLSLDDPEISIVPFRIDYLKKGNGTYAMYDLNTQPGIPGSYFWEEFWKATGKEKIRIDGNNYDYYRVFPQLGNIFKKIACENPRVAVFQEPDNFMDDTAIGGLKSINNKTSSYGYYRTEFIQDKKNLDNYDIIEPFYFIRGDMMKVFSNYQTALDSGKPLGSNLKLEPYTSKDMAFANNLSSYLDSGDSDFLSDRIAQVSDTGSIKKRLYGMSGTGYYEGDNTIPWSGELINQEKLFPESCLVSQNGEIKKMMYDVGITSLMVFRGNELIDFNPVVDITVRAKEKHPISGPDTNVIPAAVCQ